MNNPTPLKNISDKKHKAAIQANESMTKSEEVLLHEQLKESEIRYRRLFEMSKDGILILDFETGEILDANPFIIKTISLPLQEILGKRLWEIGLFSNKEESELAFIELKAKGYIRFEDMPIQRRNGQVTEVEFISNVYLENNAKVIQCNIRDITERIKAELALLKSEQELKKQNVEYARLNKEYSELNEELKQSILRVHQINKDLILAKNKAEESDKLKTAFLSNMSHEIRTPMNAIVGFSEFLLNPRLTKSKLDEYVQIINSSSQQLLSVINDIMDISKIETGQFSINIELVDIEKLMNELFVTYKRLVDFKNVGLVYTTDNPDKLIHVKTDGNRIRQIICNLLNNAIKYTKEGEIRFGYSIDGNFLKFYVSDSGLGIDPENLSVIFQRFRQVEATDGTLNEGNGLGLSISKALIEKLGGHISVTSEPGVGSSFAFTIPYRYDTDDRITN